LLAVTLSPEAIHVPGSALPVIGIGDLCRESLDDSLQRGGFFLAAKAVYEPRNHKTPCQGIIFVEAGAISAASPDLEPRSNGGFESQIAKLQKFTAKPLIYQRKRGTLTSAF
jgi:hypothetical protein